MDIKDFSALLKAKQKELDTLMRRKLPVKVGRMAKDHYQDNFRKGGFVNGGLQRWPVTKRQQSGSKSAAAGYGPLLSRRNHLFSSVKYTPGDYRVRVANDVKYAPLHNWGGETHPTVTPRMRKFAWAMYYKAVGIRKKAAKGKRKGKTRQRELPPEAWAECSRSSVRRPTWSSTRCSPKPAITQVIMNRFISFFLIMFKSYKL